MEGLRVLVYGDINLNIIDGSAVWLTSILNVLLTNENNKVDLLLKTPIKNKEMIDSIIDYNRINKIENFKESNRLTPKQAVEIIDEINGTNNYDWIILRGNDLSVLASKNKDIKDKLICYITDFEHDIEKISNEEKNRLKGVYNNCAFYCAQTPEAKECIKSILDIECDDKFITLNPMIPNYEKVKPIFYNKNNRLIYSGKFAKDWHTKEIVDAFKILSNNNSEIRLTVVGNLFRADLEEYKESILEILNSDKKINWHKGVNRNKSNELINEADIGIAWRSSNVDNDKSVELSTKVLEYCRAGKPILLNRIKMYETLLGKDYPLFVNSEEEFISKVNRVLSDENLYRKCSEIVYEVGKKYTFIESYKNLHSKLVKRKKIVFAGHDLKFLQKFIDFINDNPNFEVKIDKWEAHDKHNLQHSKECLEWADIIFCEWGLGNAKWYSNNKKPWQKLIVRMHLQERDTVYHRGFNYDNIDKLIAISPYIYEEFSFKMNVPREKMVMIYNFIDYDKFNLPKIEDSKYGLGIVGICPRRKRLDIAIEILDKLVKIDKRYKLYVKGKKPQDYSWVWNKADEREYYQTIFDKIEQKGLGNNVIFDGHGNDMEQWFTKIGYILSTSDFESFHMAPAEGMCSGTVPVIRNWEGSNTIYDEKYIVETIDEYVKYIIENQKNIKSDSLKSYIRNNFDKNIIFKKLIDTIL